MGFSLNILHQAQTDRLVRTAESTLERYVLHVIAAVELMGVADLCTFGPLTRRMAHSVKTPTMRY